MAFGDDFAGALGKTLSTCVDPGGFGQADTAGREVSEFKSFIETLDQFKNRRDGEAQCLG